MPCTLRRPTRPRAHHDERLGPGRSAAPDEDRLVLLPSGPDTVRGSPLRGTRSSTSHRRAATENGDLERGFSPAGADCRLQGTASSPPSTAREGYRGCHRRGADARMRRQVPAGGGGEGGIRTRDGLPRTAFPVRRHSPLGDLSPDTCGPAWMGRSMCERGWRRGRDSNPRCFRTPLFESGTINHSDTSPRERIPNPSARTAGGTRLSATWWRAGGLRPRRGGCR
jgi:hypothetical protein